MIFTITITIPIILRMNENFADSHLIGGNLGGVERAREITQAHVDSNDRGYVGKLAVEFDERLVEFETVSGREHDPVGDERTRAVAHEHEWLIGCRAVDLRDKDEPRKRGIAEHAAADDSLCVAACRTRPHGRLGTTR